MRAGRLIRFITIAILAVSLTGTARAAGTPISDILEHPERFANKPVAVSGIVQNSVLPAVQDPFSKIKGEYDLTDESKATIHVSTTKEPYPNGKMVKIRGIISTQEIGAPTLLEAGFTVQPWMYVALGLLVVLAVVLIILLVNNGKGKDASDYIEEENSATLPSLDTVCPKCGTSNGLDANFCISCRNPLREPVLAGSTAHSPTLSDAGRSTKTSAYDKATVQLPIAKDSLADLTIVDGDGARRGTSLPLGTGKQKIGRKEDMDIRLDDETVSREHAKIWWQDGDFHIQDEGSTSGTFVNEQKITRQPLKDNDTIQMGKTKMVFRMLGR
jgi:hypothetical protein